MGILWFIILIPVIILSERNTWSFRVQVIALMILVIMCVSLNFGTLINRLTSDNGKLIIRWYNIPWKIRIKTDDIEKIAGDENSVRIVLKTGKIVRLPTGILEFEEKRAVRKFLKEATGF